MSRLGTALGVFVLAFWLGALSPIAPTLDSSVPKLHVAEKLEPITVQANKTDANFQRWIARFRATALRRGISTTTFSQAFRNVRYNDHVVEKDRNQSEFNLTIWQYLDRTVSESRVKNGRAAIRKHASALDQLESHYGVDKEVIAAIWGMESAYGTVRGDIPVIEALATLAFDGRRARFFESQLIAALRILQAGDISADKMTGSWAGAMGHTQFIPTSFLAYAVDATGDGKRDIWSDSPIDALASTAAYLSRFGWRKGHPWGLEIRLPKTFDYGSAGRGTRRSVAQWTASGVRDINGKPIPDFGKASVLLPAGSRGAAFLVFHNFNVILRYNNAEAYGIGVGHLADRLAGGSAFQAAWPVDETPLVRAELQEMQQLLTSLGFDTFGADGLIGPNTSNAIRAYQSAAGLAADGHPTSKLLQKLRRSAKKR